MDETSKKRIRFRDIAPVRLFITAAALLTVAMLYFLRGNAALMRQIWFGVTKPYHAFMAHLCSYIPFSAAEMTWAAAAVFAVVYLAVQIVLLFRRPGRGGRVWRTLLNLGMIASLFWAGFALFWSPCYYAPTFSEQSGVSDGAVSAEDLEAVTRYFAERCNEYASSVKRGGDGTAVVDRAAALDRAPAVYRNASAEWPFLESEELRPKAAAFSYLMSCIDFTGYFFPMTGEANLNMDFPSVYLPATAEHELSHQRGIAEEQECNFIAIAACMASDDAEFRYSGALTAYIYLGNSLAGADSAAWQKIYASLSDDVQADLRANNEYWARFENTVAQKVSNEVYGDFLEDNGQTLRLQSYGACVDLLVNYYIASAK